MNFPFVSFVSFVAGFSSLLLTACAQPASPSPEPTRRPTATADVQASVLETSATLPALLASPAELGVGQHIAADGSYLETESEAAGPMVCHIQRDSCAYRQLAVITDPAILFGNGESPPYNYEDRLVHPAAIQPLTTLA